MQAVEMYRGRGKRGGINWTKVAEHVVSRSATQCRLRLRDLQKKQNTQGTSESISGSLQTTGTKRSAEEMEEEQEAVLPENTSTILPATAAPTVVFPDIAEV